MENPLITEALDLLMYGMTTVFVFLCILILLTQLMSKFVSSFDVGSEDEPDDSTFRRVAKEAAIKFHNKNK